MKIELKSSSKLLLLKAVKEMLDLGLREAKDLVDENIGFHIIIDSEKTEEQIKAIAEHCGVICTTVKKTMHNYRVVFKDGSEVEFQAAGLKEAENAMRDMQKDPEELIELYSSPIEEERLEGPNGEKIEEVPVYSKDDINQILGTNIDIVGDHIRILHRILIPRLSDDQKEEIEKAFHYLEKHASEENVFICIYDAFADTEEVSIVEFTKTAKDTTVVNATSFLAITKVIAEEVKRVIASSQLRKVFELIACNPDPISFPGENA